MDQGSNIERNVNPREKANPFSQLTFMYTRKLFTKGFKKDLEDHDIYEVVKACQSKKCADRLEDVYKQVSKTANDKGKKPSIYRLLWNSYGIYYTSLGMLSLFITLVSSTVEPNAISHLVGYFKPGQTKMTLQDAVYYGCMLIGLKILNAMFLPNYAVYINQLAMQVRASFSSLIYRKALRLSPKALEQTSLGNIITIINKDVAQFEGAIMLFNDLWIGIIQTIYVCYLISAKIGFSSTLGVLVIIMAIPIQIFVARIIKNLRVKMNKKTDERLQETQETLSTIKIIKMYTWEKIFADRISEKRKNEVKILLLKSLSRVGLFVTSDTLGKLGFYVIVMLYIYFHTTVEAEIIFYIMGLCTTLRVKVGVIFTYSVSMVADLVASLSRIDSVLTLEELSVQIEKPDEQPQIDIRDISINLKEKDILKSITLKFETGLNIITGPLGCGKSSVIKAILRDYPIDSGDIRTRGKISYASQDPWLFPGSIKQNILFGEKYDFHRYTQVVSVCALSYDFSVLENGDETIVQDRGMNLSKGQQARINLARAIYRDSDIYLIDDALTALDPQVQDHIFKECIEGFLKGKLIILITHNSKHIANADKVVILENGRVFSIATKETITKELLDILEEIEEHSAVEEVENEVEVNEKTKFLQTVATPRKKQLYHENKKEGGVDLTVYQNYAKKGGGILILFFIFGLYVASAFAISSNQVMLTEWINKITAYAAVKDKNFGNNTVDIEKLKSLYFPSDLLNTTSLTDALSPVASLSSIQTAESPTAKLPVFSIINNISYTSPNLTALTEDQNKTYHILLQLDDLEDEAKTYLNLYSLILLAAIILELLKQYSFFRFATNASIRLHKQMITSVVFGKMTFFDNFFIGNILNRFSQDLSLTDEALPLILNLFISAILQFGGIVYVMVHVNWVFLAPCIGVFILFIIMRYFYMFTARSLKRLEAATRSPLVGYLNSSMEGLTTVRAYKAEEILKNEFDRHQDLNTSARFTYICSAAAFVFYMTSTTVTLNAYVILRFLFTDTDTLAGDVGLTLSQVGSMSFMLQFALMQWSETENLMTSVERAMEFTKIEPELTGGQETPNWPSGGEIEYSKVSLKYTNSNENVLTDITFKVKPQEKIGIVGRTGAGKSSIIATLYRLYNYEGTILIDGIDIKTLSLKYLRQHISIIPQDPILFSGTIRTNIDPLNEFTDEEVWRVLHKVHLDNKVSNLLTHVEDTNFSSGERQLLALARAIVRRNKIVVLDEATANMDPETEQVVQKAIGENFSACTKLIIAHRLDSISDCNKVMVLNRGQIVEYDDPAVLMKDPNSTFSKMMRSGEKSSD